MKDLPGRSACAGHLGQHSPTRLALGALLLWGALMGCNDRRAEFLAGRVVDRCDGQWPVCDQIAGCLLGDTTYTEGRFPGDGRVLIRLSEPATVRATFFVEDLVAQGVETVVTFYEDACRSRLREPITGQAFAAESQEQGVVSREVDLTGLGDHLIEFQSDARASYLFKVDVTPKRLTP